MKRQHPEDARLEPMVLLARGLMHDLNNTFAPLLAYPEMIMDMCEDPDQREMLQDVVNGAKASAALIKDMQKVLRCGAGIKPEEHDANDILEGLFQSPRFRELQAANPGIQIIARKNSSCLPVMASKNHLQQALFILIRQELAGMPKEGLLDVSCGKSLLQSVSWDPSMQPGEYATLRFRHTYTVEASEKQSRNAQLERAFANGIVKDLGGGLRVEPERKGCCTTFYLPLQQAAAQPVSQSNGFFPMKTPRKPNQQRILVVDDLQTQRRLTSLLLEDLGYQVATAGSGEEALAYLQSNHVDLMLLDMQMDGEFDGYDTFRESQRLRPDIRCVVVSAFSDSERAQLTLQAGAAGPLAKPYRLDDLDRAVRKALTT